jgi:hypothetical protein
MEAACASPGRVIYFVPKGCARYENKESEYSVVGHFPGRRRVPLTVLGASAQSRGGQSRGGQKEWRPKDTEWASYTADIKGTSTGL